MYTHNLCILHAPLSNASHKANCHSPPKISKSRINLGNKSLSEIWSASWCGPERSAAWESWQKKCAKKGIRLLVSFFLSFFPHTRVFFRGWDCEFRSRKFEKTQRNGSGLKAVIAGSTCIILDFGWQKTDDFLQTRRWYEHWPPPGCERRPTLLHLFCPWDCLREN